MYIPNLEMLIFLAASILGLVSAALAILHKSLTYAAFFLAMLGISNSILMSLLGFTVLAVFHIAVYVGAAVIFILFSVTLLKEPPPPTPSMRMLALTASAVLIFCLLFIFKGLNVQAFGNVSYKSLSALLISKYKFALIITTLTLVTTLIEALTLAMRGEKI